jgi:hypothetical protein
VLPGRICVGLRLFIRGLPICDNAGDLFCPRRSVCEALMMLCPVCRQRKARRECPALGQTICTVCCGTKRLVEINCPSDCVYLASAREHPAAVIRRQRERDVAALLPTIRHLTERQYQLFFLFQTQVSRYQPEGFARLVDEDVAEAAGAYASTLETAGRGIIYEHAPQSLPASRLVKEFQTLLVQIKEQGATIHDREAAIVLRAVEQGARETRKHAEGGDTAYLSLMGRLLQLNLARQQATTEATPGQSSLIVP